MRGERDGMGIGFVNSPEKSARNVLLRACMSVEEEWHEGKRR